jgi:hypothetical protein
MGFYPVCPGSPVYEIGSPIFAKSVVRLANGKEFTIIANHVSSRNKYIQSAQLNGTTLNKAWFEHAAIAKRWAVGAGNGRPAEHAMGKRTGVCTAVDVAGADGHE